MSITQKAVVEYLLNLASQYGLVEQVVEGCDNWFRNECGQIEGWGAQDLQKHFFSHTLVFKRVDWDLIYIDTRLNLPASGGQLIGCYLLITTLEGEVDDDYLIIERSRAEWEGA